jgi:hypothetical protein
VSNRHQIKRDIWLEVLGFIRTEGKIEVMVRNQEPQYKCTYCNEEATLISSYDGDLLCESCDVEEESYCLPLVNSPRTGVCSYGG